MNPQQAHKIRERHYYFIVSPRNSGEYWSIDNQWTTNSDEAVSFVTAEQVAAYAQKMLYGRQPYKVVLRVET